MPSEQRDGGREPDDVAPARSSPSPPSEVTAEGTSPAAPPDRSPRRPPEKALPVWQETLLLLATALVLALIIKTFFVQAFYIPSGSMRETLKVNDRILVEKVSYWFGDVQRGDIVVFDDPANWLGLEDGQNPQNALTKAMATIGLYPTGGHLVKRVIGTGGDRVACEGGKVRVNGATLHERDYVTLPKEACAGSWSYRVPPEHLWVMGDNRDQSADSRLHVGDPGGGFIPVDDVVGKVFVVIWPVGHWGFIHRPGTFDSPALDQAAAVVSGTAPVGLALIGSPPFYRRCKNRMRD